MPAAKSLENLNENAPLFTPEERKTLLDKASKYFHRSSPTLLHAFYRNKTKEYFDEIRETAKSTGADEVMRGSPFGDTRLTVDADYLIPPDQSTLFFADFCCHRNRSDKRKKHMVILVLCQHGTNVEHECRQNLQLIELNLFDNPFLRVKKHEKSPYFMPTFVKQTYTYYVTTTTNEDSINIFHAGDFNITKALNAKKCRFSTIETSDRGYVDRRGLELDRRCTICNIFPMEDPNNNTLEMLDLGTGGQWRLWTFICTDLPSHYCLRVNQNAKMLWPIDYEIEKICAKTPELPPVFSFDQWKSYIRKGKLFQNAAEMMECIRAKNCFVPSTLSRHVFFDKHLLGMALFRDGVSPDYDCPMNGKGGYFQLRLFYQKNDHIWLSTMDQMFHKFMDFILNRLPSEMVQMVNGTFVRCEISKHYKAEDNANHYAAIPLLIKIELWIRDKAYKVPFEDALTNWSQDVRFTNFFAKNFAENTN